MAAVVTTNLPDDVQSLSDLIGIESTTQAALYVALRKHWITYDDAESMVRSALQPSPFFFTNTSSHCEVQSSSSFLFALIFGHRDLEIKYIWTGRRISVTSVLFFVVRWTLKRGAPL